MVHANLSRYLKQKRQASGLTQREVAQVLGYSSPQFVCNWERGLAKPPVNAIKKICKLYKLELPKVYDMVLQDALEQKTKELHRQFFRSGR
jgi:transcriptional regulator with XRE-family HTH domain